MQPWNLNIWNVNARKRVWKNKKVAHITRDPILLPDRQIVEIVCRNMPDIMIVVFFRNWGERKGFPDRIPFRYFRFINHNQVKRTLSVVHFFFVGFLTRSNIAA